MRRVRDMGMHGLHNVRGDGVSGVWGAADETRCVGDMEGGSERCGGG